MPSTSHGPSSTNPLWLKAQHVVGKRTPASAGVGKQDALKTAMTSPIQRHSKARRVSGLDFLSQADMNDEEENRASSERQRQA